MDLVHALTRYSRYTLRAPSSAHCSMVGCLS